MKSLKTVIAPLCMVLLLLAACKKEDANPQNIIEFDMDGVHHRLPGSGTLSIDTLLDGPYKFVEVTGSEGTFSNFLLSAGEDISHPTDNCIATGSYPPSLYSQGCNDSVTGGCMGFAFGWIDVNGAYTTPYDDSTSSLTITWCSGSVLSATFEGIIADPLNSNNRRHVTNGKLTAIALRRL